jgi:hypothetical protein
VDHSGNESDLPNRYRELKSELHNPRDWGSSPNCEKHYFNVSFDFGWVEELTV